MKRISTNKAHSCTYSQKNIDNKTQIHKMKKNQEKRHKGNKKYKLTHKTDVSTQQYTQNHIHHETSAHVSKNKNKTDIQEHIHT